MRKALGSYGIQVDRTLRSYFHGVYIPTIVSRSDNWKEQIRWAMVKYVLPAFGDRDMAEITRAELQTFFNKLGTGQNALNPSSVQRIKIVLSGIFNLAEADDHIPKNYVRHVRLPSPQTPKKQALSAEELRSLIEASHDRIRPFVLLCGVCGLRAGEALAVTRKAVYKGSLSVEQQVLQISGGCQVSDRLKTPQSRRSIPLPESLERAILDSGQISAIWVCSDTAGGYLTPTNAHRELELAILRAETRRVTPHELRHTFISILENDLEVPPSVVAALAGKTYQGATAGYSHTRPKQLEKAMVRLWDLIMSTPAWKAEEQSEALKCG